MAKTSRLEPGVWHEIGSEDIARRRKQLGRGVVRQDSIGRRNLPLADHIDGDSGSVSTTPRRSWVEPREVIDAHTAEFLTQLAALRSVSESAFLDRVKKLRSYAGWDHLTDEQAAEQLGALAEKVARAVTEPVYQRKGLKVTDMDRVGTGHETQAILLPGQVGR